MGAALTIGMTPQEIAEAKERGRSMAESALIADPIKRAELETRVGRDTIMRKYPAAYQN
jgi:hypothetical protein